MKAYEVHLSSMNESMSFVHEKSKFRTQPQDEILKKRESP